MIETESKKRALSLQRGIETATGESYNDLTEAVNAAIDGYGQGGTEELEAMIDESGVLDNTDITIKEKIEYLVEQMKTVLEMKSVSFGINASKTKKVVLNCKGLNSLYNAFYNCGSLVEVHLTNTQNVIGWSRTFCDNRLHTIETLDLSKADKDIIGNSGHQWINAPYLEHLKIVPETIHNSITFVWCIKLTAESTQSIFDGLAIVTTAQTLTLPPNLKILQSQVDNANAKGWTVAGGTVVSEEEYYG